jgi:hypothetical protein
MLLIWGVWPIRGWNLKVKEVGPELKVYCLHIASLYLLIWVHQTPVDMVSHCLKSNSVQYILCVKIVFFLLVPYREFFFNDGFCSDSTLNLAIIAMK